MQGVPGVKGSLLCSSLGLIEQSVIAWVTGKCHVISDSPFKTVSASPTRRDTTWTSFSEWSGQAASSVYPRDRGRAASGPPLPPSSWRLDHKGEEHDGWDRDRITALRVRPHVSEDPRSLW